VAVWLSLALAACTGSRPEGPPTVAPVPDAAPPGWWQGDWQLDAERLAAPGELAGLDADARSVATALATGLAPSVRLEIGERTLTQVHGAESTTEAFSPEPEGDRVTLRLSSGARIQLLRQGEARAQLARGNERPLPMLRRAER
jgi:hypothetical protein